MSVSASLTLVVKGDPENKVLGDCPFCHRALLAMEQKSLEFDKIYVEFNNKPQWLFDVNPEGTVPVLKDNEKYIPDSGAIVEYLEDKFPTPAVPVDEDGLAAGNGIFGAFRNFFLNKDAAQEESLKAAFEAELKSLNERLKVVPGPFLGGSTFNSADCLLLPRLYHAKTALGHFKKWTFPESLDKVENYLKQASETEVWKRCEYSPDLIIAGWGTKL
eukprot:g5010.t1